MGSTSIQDKDNTSQAVLDALSAELEAYCSKHGLRLMSADELLYEIQMADHQSPHIGYLNAFIAAWDACSDLDSLSQQAGIENIEQGPGL